MNWIGWWRNCGEIVEQLRWIVRTEIRVAIRDTGKMILKRLVHRMLLVSLFT
jgi:hypothetical protein